MVSRPSRTPWSSTFCRKASTGPWSSPKRGLGQGQRRSSSPIHRVLSRFDPRTRQIGARARSATGGGREISAIDFRRVVRRVHGGRKRYKGSAVVRHGFETTGCACSGGQG